MEKQLELLDCIVKEIYQESEGDWKNCKFQYKFNSDEGWLQYGIYVVNKNDQEILIQEANYSILTELCQKLHDEMQAHTGGDWRKMVLTINEEGKVNTKFSYEIQSCMDQFKE